MGIKHYMKKIVLVILVVLSFLMVSCTTNQTVYHVSDDQSKQLLKFTDQNPNNANQVILVYNRVSVNSTWDNGSTYNREHVWAQNPAGGHHLSSTQSLDLHNIKPSNPQINNNRGNLPFGENATGGFGRHQNRWFPGHSDKGDVARILMYMAYTYDFDLSVMIEPSLALKWHNEDPVDAFELNRNEVIKQYQGNDNPFITNANFADEIYGEKSTNIGLLWFVGLIVTIVIIVIISSAKINTNKDLIIGTLVLIFIIFTIICLFVWSWWGTVLIIALPLGIYYLNKYNKRIKS